MVDARISDYLRGLDIKTVKFGGFDKADTFEKMKRLSDLYEEILAERADGNVRSEQDQTGEESQQAGAKEITLLNDRILDLEAELKERRNDVKNLNQRLLELTQLLNTKDEELKVVNQQKQEAAVGQTELRSRLEEAGELLAEIKERKIREEQMLAVREETMLKQTEKACDQMKAEACEEVEAIRLSKARAREDFKRIYEQMKLVLRSFDEDEAGR